MRQSLKGLAGGFFTKAARKDKWKDTGIGLLLAFGAFAVYFLTLSPSIGADDTGELAAVAATLGIAHPTGYPLFTLLGWIFAHLPLGDLRVIVKLNLMVAVCCAAAVFVFYRLFLVLLRAGFLTARMDEKKPGKAGQKGAVPAAKRAGPAAGTTTASHRLAAAAGVVALAFSRVFWANAVVLEVYALHLVFLALTLLLFVQYLQAERDGDENRNRLWFLFAYVFGLSFANHGMTVLLFPGLLYLYFTARGFGKPAWTRIVQGIPLFFLGLTPYLYLPVRAAQAPLMNWGGASTWENFRAHLTARQYEGMMFSSAEIAQTKFVEFFTELPLDLGYAPLALALFGLWHLLRRERRLAVFSLLVFGACVFYAVNYDFNDVNFRLNAHVMAAFWAGCGVRMLLPAPRAGKNGALRTVWRAWIVPAGLFMLALAPLAVHYRAMDSSGDYSKEDYAREMLNSTGPGGVIVSGQDQVFIFPAYYLQLVEGVRPDVTILSRSMMTMPWYYGQLQGRDPELIRRAQPEVEVFLSAASRVGMDPRTPNTEGEIRFREVFQSILQKGASGRPVYTTVDAVRELSEAAHNGITGIYAEGLAYRLFYDTARPPAKLREFSFHPFCARCDSVNVGYIREHYAAGYTAQGVQAAQDGDLQRAWEFCRKAQAMDPLYDNAHVLEQKLRELQSAL